MNENVPLIEMSKFANWYVPFFISGSEEFKVSYHPEIQDGKLQAIYISDSGAGNVLEASSHEFAHIIDVSMRGKLKRLLKDDYGMSFDRVPDPKKALAFEAKVMSIQAKLLRIAGFPWDEIVDAFRFDIVPSLRLVNAFYYLDAADFPAWEYIIRDAKKLSTATLFKHWQNATNYLKALM